MELVGWNSVLFPAGVSLTPSFPSLLPPRPAGPQGRGGYLAAPGRGCGAAGLMGVQVCKQGSHCMPPGQRTWGVSIFIICQKETKHGWGRCPLRVLRWARWGPRFRLLPAPSGVGFRPGRLLWTRSLSVKWESQWAVPHWTVVTLTWVNLCRVSKMAPCTRMLAAEIQDACALRTHGRWYLGVIPNRVPPPHPTSQWGFFYPKARVWSSVLRSESAAKDRLSPLSSFQGPRVPFPVQPQSLVVSQGPNTWRPLSRGEAPEGLAGCPSLPAGVTGKCSAVPFFNKRNCLCLKTDEN